jgi:sec-independent protein translocase protein TatC
MSNALRPIWRILTSPFRFVYWIGRGIYGWFANVAGNLRAFFTEEPEDSPLPDAFAKTVENPAGILEHLDALRKHLLRAVLALFITTGFSLVFTRQILEILARPLEGGISSLTAIDVTEPLGTVMRVALLSGFALALPYIALEVWLFIAPGVSRRSRLFGLFGIPIATLFFIGGMTFAYFVMLPVALPFLLNFMDISTIPRPSSYIKFVTGLMFWIGVAFEFPLVIYILASIGVVNASFLLKQWRLAVVIIAIVSALITPTVDPISMTLVMGPLIILYFFSIGLAALARRGRNDTV